MSKEILSKYIDFQEEVTAILQLETEMVEP